VTARHPAAWPAATLISLAGACGDIHVPPPACTEGTIQPCACGDGKSASQTCANGAFGGCQCGGSPTAPDATAQGCDGITSIGCCIEDRLAYCSNGTVVMKYCPDQGDRCGWDYDQVRYICGSTDKPDPTGANPRDCPPPP
jgi:hypothetical protein